MNNSLSKNVKNQLFFTKKGQEEKQRYYPRSTIFIYIMPSLFLLVENNRVIMASFVNSCAIYYSRTLMSNISIALHLL